YVLGFCRKTLPIALSLAFAVFLAIHGGERWRERRDLSRLPAAAPGASNVLVIVVDTLRADHLSCYGYSRSTTPHRDRIASQGVLFENALSTSSWSLPSHASLLTGMYPFEHGISQVRPMPIFTFAAPTLGDYPTLGEAMQRQGYRTGAFSANRVYFP